MLSLTLTNKPWTPTPESLYSEHTKSNYVISCIPQSMLFVDKPLVRCPGQVVQKGPRPPQNKTPRLLACFSKPQRTLLAPLKRSSPHTRGPATNEDRSPSRSRHASQNHIRLLVASKTYCIVKSYRRKLHSQIIVAGSIL